MSSRNKGIQRDLAAKIGLSDHQINEHGSAGKEIAIPAYGMSCIARHGSSVTIIPNRGKPFVQIELVEKSSVVIASDNHKAIARQKDSATLYTSQGWVEMDQTATLILRIDESVSGAQLEFNFASASELGLPIQIEKHGSRCGLRVARLTTAGSPSSEKLETLCLLGSSQLK